MIIDNEGVSNGCNYDVQDCPPELKKKLLVKVHAE